MANENLLTVIANEEFGELRVLTIDEEPMFIGKELVEKLGYKTDGTTSYSFYINKYCDEEDYIKMKNCDLQLFGISDLGRKGGYLVNESGMYSLILGSDLPSSKKFKRWVTKEVLPSIRKHGAYINDNSDTVDKEYIKYARGTIKETFMNCPVENLLDEYDNAMKFYSDKNNKLTYYSEKGMNKTNRKYRADKKLSVNESKLEISNTIKKALKERDKQLCAKGIVGCSRDLQATMNYISENITKINNSIKAGQLGAKTRENNKLKTATHKEPKLEDMVEIHKHPFAFNSMYVANKWGMFDRKKSPSYISWIKTFPKHEVMDMDYWIDKNVDFDLPIKLYLAFVTYEDRNFDTDGLIKSAQDMIFNRCMNIDDNIVECVEAKQVGKCSSYENGKIYYYIKNITE